MKKLLAAILALVMALGVTTISWASEVENVAQTTKGNTTTQYSSLAEALNAAKDGGTVELLKNVTLTGNWTTVGTESEPFKGTFDGKGYTITGLNIPTNDNEYVGLIGILDGGTVKNVKFASVSVTGKNDVGTAVGRIINGGTVSGGAGAGRYSQRRQARWRCGRQHQGQRNGERLHQRGGCDRK